MRHQVTINTVLEVNSYGDALYDEIIFKALEQLRLKLFGIETLDAKAELLISTVSHGVECDWKVKGNKIIPMCKKCGSRVKKNGLCPDQTCPYSIHQQYEQFSED